MWSICAHAGGLQRPFRMDSLICGSHYEEDLRREENNARGGLDEERRRGGKGGKTSPFPSRPCGKPRPLLPWRGRASPLQTLLVRAFAIYSLLGSFGDG